MAAAAVLLLALAGSSAAQNITDLHGSGDLLELGIDLDANQIPTRVQIEADQVRCPNGYMQLPERQYRDLDFATAERFEHRESFTARDAGFVFKVKAHIVGRRVGDERWKGKYETKVRVFYKGSKFNDCARKGGRRAWSAKPTEAAPPEIPQEPWEPSEARALAAKPKGAASKPKSGLFRLEIRGEQLTTWDYEKTMAPECDFPEVESGRQYIVFGTYTVGDAARPKVKAKRGPGGGVKLRLVRGDVTISAKGELERKYSRLYSQISACPDGGSGGGETANQDAVGTNRCTASGSLDFFLGSSIEEVENPLYTSDLSDRKPPKAPLYFAADPYWLDSTASDHNLPSACAASGQPNVDLGLAESEGEWAGALIPVAGSLPAKKLLDPRRRKTVVSFGRSVSYPNEIQTYAGPPRTKGKTRIDVTLTFTRVR